MVRVRIGPSPTGDPHVGTAYIALFNYVFAKQNKGEFILRMEDTDRNRSDPAWEGMIIDALRWLGITWSEGPDVGGPHGPYRQSERGDIYRAHVETLRARGAAYPCFCSTERLDELRIVQRQRGVATGYDGRCRALDADDAASRIAAGEAHVVRLKVPRDEKLSFVDALRGELTFDADQVDDQVLLKSDGMPTYHLANVVDDHLMGITHVIRAEEWITSTPKHVLLYRGFGWEPPVWVHMLLLRNQDKSKISKRKNPVSLNYYREAGFLPAAMCNYLAMMGWTMPDGREKFTIEDMVEHFTFERISLGGPVFDAAKLTWLNGLYLRDQPPQKMVEQWLQTILTPEALAKVAPLVFERVDKLEDLLDYIAFFFTGDVDYPDALLGELIPKKRTQAEAIDALDAVVEILDKQATLEAQDIEAKLRALCERLGWKSKELFMPVRIAVTGRKATPPLFDTMAVLGKERCRRRLRGALAALKKRPAMITAVAPAAPAAPSKA